MRFAVLIFQLQDAKKISEERAVQLEESEQSKKKVQREMEQLMIRVEELTANGAKLEKTRKRLQDEVTWQHVKLVASG